MWLAVIIGWIIFSTCAYLWHYFIEIVLDLPPVNRINITDDSDRISIAELGLRDVIRRVAREASRLPWLGNGDLHQRPISNTGNVRQPPDSTYEDLLATAILNKVIESYQQKASQNGSTAGSFSSHRSSRSNSLQTNPLNDLSLDDLSKEKNTKYLQQRDIFNRPVQVNPLLDDERFSELSEHHSIDEGYAGQSDNTRKTYRSKRLDDDTGSLSSLEDYSGGSSSSKHRDGMSLTIKQSIEEMTSSDLDSYDPQLESSDYSEINSTFQRKNICNRCNLVTHEDVDETQPEPWEENWLFQKKKTKSNIISTPVAMLVPKSSTEYRALIGDRDAEDTTDLSDIGSDNEDDESVPKNDYKSILVTSKTIIGGKNDFGFIEQVLDDDTVNVSIELTTKLSNSMEELEIVEEKLDTTSESIGNRYLNEEKVQESKIEASLEKESNLINLTEEPIQNIDTTESDKIDGEPLITDITSNMKKQNEDAAQAIDNLLILPNISNETTSTINITIGEISENIINIPINEMEKNTQTLNCTEPSINNKIKNDTNEHKIKVNEPNLPESDTDKEISENIEEYEAFAIDTPPRGVKSRAQKWDSFIEKKVDESRGSPDIPNIQTKNEKYFGDNNKIKENINEAKNSTLLKDENSSENNSVEINVQNDNEYTEKYATIGRKEIEHPTAAPRSIIAKNPPENNVLETPPLKGTIAEREHMKWQNAVPMPNNPYTAENIEKRLSQRSKISTILPNITTLERRNSYKREIDLSENNNDDSNIEVSFKILSVGELSNSDTNPSSEFSNSSVGCERENNNNKTEDKNNIDNREKDNQKYFDDSIPKEDKWELKYGSLFRSDSLVNDTEPIKTSVADNEERIYATLEDTQTNLNKCNGFDQETNNIKMGYGSLDSKYSRSDPKISHSDSRLSGCTTSNGSSLQEIFESEMNTNTNKRYGRDFYVREAKVASGARKRFSEMTQELFNKYENDGKDSLPNLEIIHVDDEKISNDGLVYIAQPVQVVEDPPKQPESLNLSSNSDLEIGELLSMVSSTDSFETSNSSDLQRVYNLDTGKIVYKSTSPTNTTRNEVIRVSRSPEGTLTWPVANKSQSIHGGIDRISSVYSSKPHQIEGTIKSNIEPYTHEIKPVASTNSSENLDVISVNSIPDNEISVVEHDNNNSSRPYSRNFNSINNIEIYEKNTGSSNDDVDFNADNEGTLSVEERKQKILNLIKENNQKLDMNENKMKPMHSLTARSLSKQFRLQNSQSSPQLNQIPPEPLRIKTYTPDINEFPQLSLKQRREFFENLNKK